MIDALYAQYIKEREGKEILFEVGGFVTYCFPSDRECFLSDIFVQASDRQKGVGRKLLLKLFGVATRRGSKVVSSNIYLGDPNANDTLRAAMACGFKVVSSTNGIITIAFELEGGG